MKTTVPPERIYIGILTVLIKKLNRFLPENKQRPECPSHHAAQFSQGHQFHVTPEADFVTHDHNNGRDAVN